MNTLMVSVSGIRGLIGNGLFPETVVDFTSAFGMFCESGKIIVGRDSRISGDMINRLVCGTLMSQGFDVLDIGICPTPTVQYNVKKLKADGGIAISASHNPNEWNALKLLNSKGEFLDPDQSTALLEIRKNSNYNYVKWNEVGKYIQYSDGLSNHIEEVIKLEFLNLPKIRQKKFKVLLDCVNGAGAYVIPGFLRELGCEVIETNCEKTGIFPRLPEPLPENLIDTMKAVKENNVDLGIVVDPDVDRLVLITDKGEPFGEENTITQAVNFILSKEQGNVVVNLSTTRAVEDVASKYNCKVFRSPVGEANVVKLMKNIGAIIGGEGSGGVILPSLHYGRDALVGIVITLQQLTDLNISMEELKNLLPQYSIAKKKIEIGSSDPDKILKILKDQYHKEKINTDDGIKIDFNDHWVHFRKSNTEPIIRIISEAKSKEKAEEFADYYYNEIIKLI